MVIWLDIPLCYRVTLLNAIALTRNLNIVRIFKSVGNNERSLTCHAFTPFFSEIEISPLVFMASQRRCHCSHLDGSNGLHRSKYFDLIIFIPQNITEISRTFHRWFPIENWTMTLFFGEKAIINSEKAIINNNGKNINISIKKSLSFNPKSWL